MFQAREHEHTMNAGNDHVGSFPVQITYRSSCNGSRLDPSGIRCVGRYEAVWFQPAWQSGTYGSDALQVANARLLGRLCTWSGLRGVYVRA